jgi:hypothetical protein
MSDAFIALGLIDR